MSEECGTMEPKPAEIFVDEYRKYIHRAGAEELLEWLKEETDFFTAPASAKHHLARPGGLVEHSVNVFGELQIELISDYEAEMETAAICGLLHDVCKANYYRLEYGVDGKVKGYTVKNKFPMGNGEKSVYLIQKYMRLKDEEALAIRWHMGAWDEAVRGGSRDLGEAMKYSPLVYWLQEADMRATHILEAEG